MKSVQNDVFRLLRAKYPQFKKTAGYTELCNLLHVHSRFYGERVPVKDKSFTKNEETGMYCM